MACSRSDLAAEVNYDLPALHDTSPSSLSQLSRNTDHVVCYFPFLLRMWPLSPRATEFALFVRESVAQLLVSILHSLVEDHPGFIFLQSICGERMCRISIVPRKHSSTKWLLDVAARVAAAPRCLLYHPDSALRHACRILMLQHEECNEHALLDSSPSVALPCAVPPFLGSDLRPVTGVCAPAGSVGWVRTLGKGLMGMSWMLVVAGHLMGLTMRTCRTISYWPGRPWA